jgi:hypothetical protein
MVEPDPAATFSVARNPEPASKLPYLIRLPLPGGDVVLKAADTWPRTSKLYCHPADWPDNALIIEEVPVRSCRRRGVAIDLILERPRENRAQFVLYRSRRSATPGPSLKNGPTGSSQPHSPTARPNAIITSRSNRESGGRGNICATSLGDATP